MNLTGLILAPANDHPISREAQVEAVLRAMVAGLDAMVLARAAGDARKAAIAQVIIDGAQEAAHLLLDPPPNQRG